MAYEPIAMAAEHDATAPHRMYPWLGTVRRYGISRAMEVRSMHTQVTLQHGQKGTKQLLAQYGEQLVCIRYRYDATRQRRLKTVELVVEETPWRPAHEASKGHNDGGRPHRFSRSSVAASSEVGGREVESGSTTLEIAP
jgi:hypothetical protein